uniref:Uncharacterized protein n=1 Tax=Rousettus aegyptiacus TaxID=9407 RepID=A0A7J8GAI4_ROUAE|nr:hypothetical protein HJG63_011496 [Rousettus aegyptiacus]
MKPWNPKKKDHVSLGDRRSLNRCRDAPGKHISQHSTWADMTDSKNPNCLSVWSGQVSPFYGEDSVGHRKWSPGKGKSLSKPQTSWCRTTLLYSSLKCICLSASVILPGKPKKVEMVMCLCFLLNRQ